MPQITWEEFSKIDIRVGSIIEVCNFPEAIKPAYKMKVDMGEAIGIKTTSAQITDLYKKKDLLNKQVLVVINLPPKKIGPFTSECLITGFYDNNKKVILAIPDNKISNGSILR